MFKDSLRALAPYILLTVVVVLAYGQLSFFVFPTKWDNLSAFFAYKYTAVSWWNSGHIPFWDPYQNLGYPMHANPQGYVWYPISWLSKWGGYTVYDLNLETVLHLLLATWGAYRVAFHHTSSKVSSLLGALAYGLSGFAVGTSHMIGFTIGLAWLPWLYWCYVSFLKQPNLQTSINLVLVLYMQITGAYVAFSIILGYWLLAIFLYYLATKKLDNLRGIGIYGAVSLVLVLALCSPYIYSIYDSLPYFSRATSLDYDPKLFAGNFSWECFGSYLFPYINSSSTGFSGVDVSLSNIFIGTIPLMLAIYGWTKLKKRKYIILITLVLFFLLALGNNTPIHQFAFNYIPGFSYFRHPYLFTLYSTFIGTMLAALGLSKIRAQQIHPKVLVVVTVSIGIILILSYTSGNFEVWQSFKQDFFSLSEKSPLNKFGHIAIQLSITTTFILLGVWALIYYKPKLLLLAVSLELISCIQLVAPLNLYYNLPIQDVKQFVDGSPTTLTNQSINQPLHSFRKDSLPFTPGIWTNRGTFAKVTEPDGYNPFVFSSFSKLKESNELDSILNQGMVTGSNGVSLSNLVIGHNQLSFDVSCQRQSTIHIHQNYHHNWKVQYVSDITLYRDEYGFIELSIPSGSRTITLEYSNTTIRILHYVSVILLCVLYVFGAVMNNSSMKIKKQA